MTMSNITEGDNNVSFGSPSSTSTLTTASTCLLDPRHAGRVVAAEFGIVRATVPFHGEHDALEPTKVMRGQGGGGRKRARSRTLTNTLAVFLARGRPGGPSSAYRDRYSEQRLSRGRPGGPSSAYRD